MCAKNITVHIKKNVQGFDDDLRFECQVYYPLYGFFLYLK